MKTLLEVISPVKKKLLVEIEPEEVSKKLDEAFKELNRRAKVQGFRPGKVPRRILEAYYGAQVVEDVARDLVKETLPKVVEETKTFPLTFPAVENETFKAGQSFKYSAIMEVKPEFELKDYLGLEVEREKVHVTDQDVQTHLEEIRKANGKLNPVGEERGVKENDYVILDYEGFQGATPMEGIKAQNFSLRVGSHEFHQDFEKVLIGHKAGDMIDIHVKFDDTYHHAMLAGKEVDFKVKLTNIKELELPELNDDFAKNLGADFGDLGGLKEKIREELIAREEKRVEKEMKRRLLQKISDRVDFELPECLIESEIDYGISTLRSNFMRMGSTLEKAGLKEEILREELRPASKRRVKELLILGEIAAQTDLTVDDTEVEDGFREMALSMSQDPQVLRRYYDAHQLLDSFKERLLEEKTLNYLIKGAKIQEIEGPKLVPAEQEVTHLE